LPLSEINEILADHKANPAARLAQKCLADSLCTLIHGEDALERARHSADLLFGNQTGDMSDAQLQEAFRNVPSFSVGRSEVSTSTVADLLVTCQLAPSKGEAKRLIQGGGAYIFDDRLQNPQDTLSAAQQQRSMILFRAGKKKYALLHILPDSGKPK
jgi:tyrosyl-tRNA synthetase